MGVEGGGVEIQPQYSLDPDSIDSFWENTEMLWKILFKTYKTGSKGNCDYEQLPMH